MISNSKLDEIIEKVLEYVDVDGSPRNRGGEPPALDFYPRDKEKCRAEIRKVLEVV